MKRLFPAIFLLLFIPAGLAQEDSTVVGPEPAKEERVQEHRDKDRTAGPDNAFFSARLDEMERHFFHLEDKFRFLEDRIENLDRRVDDLRNRHT